MRSHFETIRQDPESKDSKVLFVECVNLLTEEALGFYFISPMDIIDAGTLTRKFVGMGMSGSLKMISSMGKKATSSLDREQMLGLVDFMEGLLKQ